MSALQSLAGFAAWAAATYPDGTALRYQRGAGWHTVTFPELAAQVTATAQRLATLGVRPGDRVGLFAETCPEWTVCDLAIADLGAVSVPVYPANPEPEVSWVLGDSAASLVVCGTEEQRRRCGTTPATMITTIAGQAGGSDGWRSRAPEVAADQAQTIVYTSGTTGPPKGCVITHGNWVATLKAFTSLTDVGPGSDLYLYLPLAHMFARTVQYVAILTGATICYFGGDITKIVDELPEVRPTHIPSVPRLFEKAYARVAGMLDADQLKEYGPALVQGVFGGRVRESLTGGAPIAPDILEFFAHCGVQIYEAYGMSESTAIISTNCRAATRIGSVGRPLPGVEVRIADDGEVLARGPNVFAGYHNNPEATAVALRDGWLHTGDLGELDADGYLHITGRKKDLIITSSGKNLSPANTENILRQHPLISHAVMYGDRRPYAVALITVDDEEARRSGLTDDQIKAQVADAVSEANSQVSPPEQIRRYTILDRDLTAEEGELTPSLKVRRSVVHERHQDLFNSLYDN